MDRAVAGLVLRWLRAVVLAAVALLCGMVAHESAGGYLPGATVLLLLLALTAAVTAPMLGSELSTRRVVVLLTGGQSFIHVALTALRGHRGDVPVGPAALTVPMGGLRAELVLPSWVGHLVEDLTGPHALMAVAHLVAAAMVGWWLATGERALWTLVTLASRPLTAAVRSAALAALAVLAVTATASATGLHRLRLRPPPAGHNGPLAPRTTLLSRVVIRRGPPLPSGC